MFTRTPSLFSRPYDITRLWGKQMSPLPWIIAATLLLLWFLGTFIIHIGLKILNFALFGAAVIVLYHVKKMRRRR